MYFKLAPLLCKGVVLLALSVVVFSLILWGGQSDGLNRSKNWLSQLFDDKLGESSSEFAGRNHCSPLTGRELLLYDRCLSRVHEEKRVRKFGSVVEGPCCFINGAGRLVVGLGSFPGSGNTWLRGLLERATGICTGINHYCPITSI